MTPQEKMSAALSKMGIPAKEIKCYGSQVMITCHCKDSADKWLMTLNKFCKKVLSASGVDCAKENKGSCLNPTIIKVYRVWGTI